jgi:alkylated DNA repair dioxygenase AlkB
MICISPNLELDLKNKLIDLSAKKRFKIDTLDQTDQMVRIKSLIKKHSIRQIVLTTPEFEPVIKNLVLELNCQIYLVNTLEQFANLFFKLEDSWVRYNCGICDNQICFSTFAQGLNWGGMTSSGSFVPRLINVQYKPNTEGLEPIYRHPADELPVQTPWNPQVELIGTKLSQMLGCEFNHVLIQMYRSGSDNISAHSDKTLDIVKNTPIVNYTLGATRFLRLCLKSDHTSWDQFALSNDSIFVLGPKTNMLYTHEIRPDKRPECEKSSEELDFDSQRISFTFRCIGTFVKPDNTLVGQGAPINPNISDDSDKLVKAFGIENKSSDFDWDTTYGSGFKSLGLVNKN